MGGVRQSADAACAGLCQIGPMRWTRAAVGAGLAAFVIVAAQACAQRNAGEPWEPSNRELGRSLLQPNGSSETRSGTLEALNKILASPRLSAFDRSIYLS